MSNVLYKVFSMFLANRLKNIKPQLLLEHQNAFMSDHLISNNILVAFEILHYMKKHKGKTRFITLKLDVNKAYDRVEWSYMEKVLVKISF